MATYNYVCKNEECEMQGFQLMRSMSEYQEPADCPQCNTSCERAPNDWCKNFKLVGSGWYNSGYNGASNGTVSYKEELRKAGKDPNKWDGK